MGAPYCVTEELMDHFKVAVVVTGQTECIAIENGSDPYEVRYVFCVYLTYFVACQIEMRYSSLDLQSDINV